MIVTSVSGTRITRQAKPDPIAAGSGDRRRESSFQSCLMITYIENCKFMDTSDDQRVVRQSVTSVD
jgi:hypothetical protein